MGNRIEEMNFSFPTETLTEKEQRKVFVSYWLKRIFIDDWLMKVVALIITLALWFGVTSTKAPKTTRLRNVTLNALISNDLEITNSPVQEVDLVVTGDKSKVEQLNPNDLIVSLDLSDIKEGDRTIQITPQNITVDLPTGVKVDEIQPDKIAIQLERVEEYEVPVKVETEGNLAEGYEVYKTTVIPEKVRVRGPSSFVKSLDFVSTEKIDLSGRKSDFTARQIPIIVSDSKVSVVNTAAVTVAFRIGKKRIERLFVVPYNTEHRSGRASVLLYGADIILENLSAEDISVVENDEDSSKLRVVLPEDIRSQVEIRSVKYRE